jgi:hypothetical protein
MAELFEEGRSYTFYFSREHGDTVVTGTVLSYESPIVKIETEGLIRIINCSSSYFVEAVTRREDLDAESPDSEE